MKKFRSCFVLMSIALALVGCQGTDSSESYSVDRNAKPETETAAATPASGTAEATEGTSVAATTDPKVAEANKDKSEGNPVDDSKVGKNEQKVDMKPTQTATEKDEASKMDGPEDKAAQEEERSRTSAQKPPASAKPVEASKEPPKRIPPSPAKRQTADDQLVTFSNPNATAANFVGSWKIIKAAKQIEGEKKLIAEMKKQGKDWKPLNITISFKGDGTFTMKEVYLDQDRAIEGTYKVVKGMAELMFTKVNGQAPKLKTDKDVMKIGVAPDGKKIRRIDNLEFSKS